MFLAAGELNIKDNRKSRVLCVCLIGNRMGVNGKPSTFIPVGWNFRVGIFNCISTKERSRRVRLRDSHITIIVSRSYTLVTT